MLGFTAVLACRTPPPLEPEVAAAPLASIDDVPIRGWHLAHIDTLVACMQRHGTPDLRPRAWRRAWAPDRVVLPLSGTPLASWTRVYWRHDRPQATFGLELRLRHERVELTYAEEIEGGAPVPVARATYFAARVPEFWIDLEGPDLFAPLRDPVRAREAGLASLSAHERAEDERTDNLHVCHLRHCMQRIPASVGEREVERDRMRLDMARRRQASCSRGSAACIRRGLPGSRSRRASAASPPRRAAPARRTDQSRRRGQSSQVEHEAHSRQVAPRGLVPAMRRVGRDHLPAVLPRE